MGLTDTQSDVVSKLSDLSRLIKLLLPSLDHVMNAGPRLLRVEK